MEAVSAVNATQDELRLPDPPDDDPGYHDYDPNAVANPPVLPTLVFEGMNFPEDPIKLLSVQVVLILAYSTIIVLGVLGNSLVIYVIYRFKTLRTVTNFFIANLAVADLLVNTLCLPFTLVYTLQGEWKFGSTLCFLLPYAQGLAVHVSTVTLNVIALDRHSTSCRCPSSPSPTPASGPNCAAHVSPAESVGGSSAGSERHRRRRKTTKMLVTMVVVFAVSWLPFHAFQLATDIDSTVLDMRDYRLLYTVFHVVAMCSTFANPLLYGWMNRNYRAAFLAVFKCGRGGERGRGGRLDSIHPVGGGGGGGGGRGGRAKKIVLETQDVVSTHLNATDV
ncbi:hypothetical protein L3Q82_003754 [Scortum barcoo]|uniref:Uncharacterized protein n=1 Tax=Scortum barcoo TaxID=214431 RepID=A0ACB8X813_9TELE|nr:hypothetical protein L3Q82_003754 [Scortum barcoo]